MNPSYSLEFVRHGDVCVARLTGDVDLANASEVEAGLAGAIPPNDVLVVDITGVTYFDSTGFALLGRLAHRFAVRVVLSTTSVIYRAFRITGLGELVAVFETVEDALRARPNGG